ncbi:MAG: mechanosensitive ion channel family protein [bacterium]
MGNANTVRLIWLCFLGMCEIHRVFAGGPLAEFQAQAISRSLVGQWSASAGQEKIELQLTDDGRFSLGDTKGTYLIENNMLRLRAGDIESSYEFQLTGDQLKLSGAGLAIPLTFQQKPENTDYTTWLFNFSPRSAVQKLRRILVIIVIVVLAQLLIRLLKGLDQLLVLAERGPLGLFYKSHRKRALTIHSLVLNLIKYVVFFTALGYILSELGINYTAYLASLSVIGLAVGFGSQGLVQDMVTGFFVIFENQYDVGDMVEISGQVGVVEELGLRMTRLRNYSGQTVVIPNRNIAVVGNFAKGAQQASVDVAIDPKAADRATEILKQTGEELARQFSGVILTKPEVGEPLSLKTGEHFARLSLAIWPQQQWVVDQQLVPRIREAFKRGGLEIPNDLIAVSYHARERQMVR